MFIRTDRGAPNYRIICIDLANPEEENWKTLIAVRLWLILICNFRINLNFSINYKGTRKRRSKLGCLCKR